MKKLKNIIIILLLISNLITGFLAFKYKSEIGKRPEQFKNLDKNTNFTPPNKDFNKEDKNNENSTDDSQENTNNNQ